MRRKHHSLEVWRESLDLVEECYRLTAQFPSDEKFGLTSQIRRSAASIPANVAEGAARQTAKEWVQFLFIARGSLVELETHLEIARRLKLAPPSEEIDDRCDRLFAKLNNLIARLKSRHEESK